MRFLPLVKMGDALMWYKYIVKNVARRHGKTATFMPKPIFGDNGSRHARPPVDLEGREAALRRRRLRRHERARDALHRRHPEARAGARRVHQPDDELLPPPGAGLRGAGQPRVLAAATAPRRCRIPMYSPSPKAKRIEVRFPDPTCNGYIAFAAMLMAGLDGIERRLDPGEPLDKDIYALTPEELKDVPSMPGSLDEALGNLEEGPRLPAQGRRLHRGRRRDLDRVQDGERDRRAAPASASVRVRALLRRLIRRRCAAVLGRRSRFEHCRAPCSRRDSGCGRPAKCAHNPPSRRAPMKTAFTFALKLAVTLGIFVLIFLEFGGGFVPVDTGSAARRRARSRSPTRHTRASSAGCARGSPAPSSRRRASRCRSTRCASTPPSAPSSCAPPTATTGASSRDGTAARAASPPSTFPTPGGEFQPVPLAERAGAGVLPPAGVPARPRRDVGAVGGDPQPRLAHLRALVPGGHPDQADRHLRQRLALADPARAGRAST